MSCKTNMVWTTRHPWWPNGIQKSKHWTEATHTGWSVLGKVIQCSDRGCHKRSIRYDTNSRDCSTDWVIRWKASYVSQEGEEHHKKCSSKTPRLLTTECFETHNNTCWWDSANLSTLGCWDLEWEEKWGKSKCCFGEVRLWGSSLSNLGGLPRHGEEMSDMA